ncbi:MAG TPA: sodium:solute symporter [Pyrinomonadaceae bacterium]|jgi:SSS family transporter|nr:sodium:solute symporter [Pyrinomonadaceae bacterium]
MRALDLFIIFGYLVGITAFGVWFSGKQETTRDYFLGDRTVPWWAIAASIVATETSTITFISVPGIAFARGGNFQFLQLVFGYLLGRIVISLLFIPSYFRGELLTVYQLLERRFGLRIKMLAAALFVVMRNIADGIRLLLTAFVLAAVYVAFQPAADAETITIYSIILLGAVMIIFTYFGGMEAVIWVEVVQLGIYIAGALAAAIVLISAINGGFGGALALGTQFDKFDVVDWGWRATKYTIFSPTSFWGALPFSDWSFAFQLPFDLTKTYTLWAGLIGGCFLTMSTHGTDQYLVQRYLCTDRPRRAAAALLSSGGVVLAQFIGFLFIGALLFAFYQPHSDPLYANFAGACARLQPDAAAKCLSDPAFAGVTSANFPFTGGDRVFPDFITKHLPSGLSGLVVAAIFAAALSSSLNSIAATAVNDLYKPFARRRKDRHYLRVSHWLTLAWGIVQIAVALFFMRRNRSALDQALSIAGLINGPVLGIFLVGTFLRRVSEPPALIGMLVSIACMLYVRFMTPLAWTWYVLLGSLITFVVAYAASFAFAPASPAQQDELAPGAAVENL